MPLFSKKKKGMIKPKPRADRSKSLFQKMDRRKQLTEDRVGIPEDAVMECFNPALEFKNMSRADQMKYEEIFSIFDSDGDGLLTLEEIKTAMRKLGTTMTHVEFKNMVRDLDTDGDGMLDLREFMYIFYKMQEGSHSAEMKKLVTEIEVAQVGVGGAKNFFEDKASRQVETPLETELRMEKEAADAREAIEEEKRKKLAAKAGKFGAMKQVKKKKEDIGGSSKITKLKVKRIKKKVVDNTEEEESEEEDYEKFKSNLNERLRKQASIRDDEGDEGDEDEEENDDILEEEEEEEE